MAGGDTVIEVGVSDPTCPRPFPSHRLCFNCGAPIQECMGCVLGRDMVAHDFGTLMGSLVRELCYRCADTKGLLAGIGFYPGYGLDWIRRLDLTSDGGSR